MGLTARRGPKVQRSPNFKFNLGPRSALDHAQPTHMQCICNSNKIENAKLLIFKLQISQRICKAYAEHIQILFNIKFKAFKASGNFFFGHVVAFCCILRQFVQTLQLRQVDMVAPGCRKPHLLQKNSSISQQNATQLKPILAFCMLQTKIIKIVQIVQII